MQLNAYLMVTIEKLYNTKKLIATFLIHCWRQCAVIHSRTRPLSAYTF